MARAHEMARRADRNCGFEVAQIVADEDGTHADFEDFIEEDLEPAKPASRSGFSLLLALSWAAVGVPLAWGVSITLLKALKLFQ